MDMHSPSHLIGPSLASGLRIEGLDYTIRRYQRNHAVGDHRGGEQFILSHKGEPSLASRYSVQRIHEALTSTDIYHAISLHHLGLYSTRCVKNPLFLAALRIKRRKSAK